MAQRAPAPTTSEAGAPRRRRIGILVLQALYSLSDEATEGQIKDRLSFQRFLGLGLDGTVPDAMTVWPFRERLVKAKVIDRLFARFDAALTDRGISPWAGKSSTPRS